MSSMSRSIRRGMARRNGTFIAQKPLRDKSNRSFKQMFIEALMKNRHIQRMMADKKEN